LASRELIPADLADSIERQTDASITEVIPRGGGGASRQGAEVTLRHADGHMQIGYLAFDTRAGDPSRIPYFEREAAILEALSGPLSGKGVLVPYYIASEPAHLALFTEFTVGMDRFEKATDTQALARDFMAQLVALHNIDPASLGLKGFDDPSIPPAQRIAARLAELRADLLANNPDPILLLALAWLVDNVPADRGPSVIVHGDAGPGNFLHQQNKVTALLDWELTHFGDPMEDLAQCWVRSLVQPFVPMREAFAAYEAAGGIAVDVDRVRYHRLYFQMSFMVPGHIAAQLNVSKSAMQGITLMFGAMHRRVVVESIAELSGTQLAEYQPPEVPATDADSMFEIALDDIRNDIVPRVADQHATTKAKSLARIIKYWRARDRYGAVYDKAELDEISGALGERFDSVMSARSALARAIDAGKIDRMVALQLCHNRVTRETSLMADAMGALAKSSFAPLD
jgi:aminoglycoside phosphotransferase